LSFVAGNKQSILLGARADVPVILFLRKQASVCNWFTKMQIELVGKKRQCRKKQPNAFLRLRK